MCMPLSLRPSFTLCLYIYIYLDIWIACLSPSVSLSLYGIPLSAIMRRSTQEHSHVLTTYVYSFCLYVYNVPFLRTYYNIYIYIYIYIYIVRILVLRTYVRIREITHTWESFIKGNPLIRGIFAKWKIPLVIREIRYKEIRNKWNPFREILSTCTDEGRPRIYPSYFYVY